MQKIISKDFQRGKNTIAVVVRLLRLSFSEYFSLTQIYLSVLGFKFNFFSFIAVNQFAQACAALLKALELCRWAALIYIISELDSKTLSSMLRSDM